MKKIFNFIIVNADNTFETVSLPDKDIFNPEDYIDVFYKHKKLDAFDIHVIYDGLLQGEENKLMSLTFNETGYHGKCILVHYNGLDETYSGLTSDELEYYEILLKKK
jgi:hypothetical protein